MEILPLFLYPPFFAVVNVTHKLHPLNHNKYAADF